MRYLAPLIAVLALLSAAPAARAADLVAHPFALSYGSPQTVEVAAPRSLGPVTVHWSVNGTERTAPTVEYAGGERYGAPTAGEHRLRAQVSGFSAGDDVRVWFAGGGQSSTPFTFHSVQTHANGVLVMAAEDYTGTNPFAPHAGPEYLSAYTDALRATGTSYDVYDVDARGRTAPDALGVLSHYDIVIWYTGDDVFVRDADQPGGTGTTKLFADEIDNARDYLNDGGRLLVSGQQALQGAWAQLIYNPDGTSFCQTNNLTGDDHGCVAVTDDFLRDWLGADRSGPASADVPLVAGSLSFRLQNQFAPTLYIPTATARRTVAYERPPAFKPASGDNYAYAESRDDSYQRLMRTVDLRQSGSGSLRFKVSYDTDPGFDYVFVEATRPARTTGPRCPTATVTPALTWSARRATSAGRRRTRSSPTTRPIRTRTPTIAWPPAPRAPGTPRRATRAATRTGTSTSRTGPASRSRSRSPTRRTTPPTGSAWWSTTCR